MANQIVCIGNARVEEWHYLKQPIFTGGNHVSAIELIPGGVSANLAHQLELLGLPAELICVLGNDSNGKWLQTMADNVGIKLNGALHTTSGFTTKYTAIVNNVGHLHAGFISNANEHLITPEFLEEKKEMLVSAACLFADATLPVQTLNWLAKYSKEQNVLLIIDPVNNILAEKIAALDISGFIILIAQKDELDAMSSKKAGSVAKQIKELLNKGIHQVWLYDEQQGSAIFSLKHETIMLYTPNINPIDNAGNKNAAISGWILGKWLGKSEIECLQLALTLAAEMVQQKSAIISHLNIRKIFDLQEKYFGKSALP